MSGHSARSLLDCSGNDLMSQKVTPHEKRAHGVRIRFLAFNESAPRTPFWAQNAHPRTRIVRPNGVEGGSMYIDAGCNVYFDFSLRMNERKIPSHSGHAILAAQIAVFYFFVLAATIMHTRGT